MNLQTYAKNYLNDDSTASLAALLNKHRLSLGTDRINTAQPAASCALIIIIMARVRASSRLVTRGRHSPQQPTDYHHADVMLLNI